MSNEHIKSVVEERVADYLSRAYDSLCEQYGVDNFDWGYPDEADSMVAEQNLAAAWTEALERAIYWKA